MAYVNMFATVQGTNRGTSGCMRGQVNSVSCWINSVIGEVMKADASYYEEPMPDMRTIPKERREAVKQDVRDRRQVRLNIDIEPNDKFIIKINGIEIPLKRLKQLQEMERERFELQIGALTKLRDNGKQLQAMQLATQIITR